VKFKTSLADYHHLCMGSDIKITNHRIVSGTDYFCITYEARAHRWATGGHAPFGHLKRNAHEPHPRCGSRIRGDSHSLCFLCVPYLSASSWLIKQFQVSQAALF